MRYVAKKRRINLLNIHKKLFNILLPLRKLSSHSAENIDNTRPICYHKNKGGEYMTKTKRLSLFLLSA